MSLGSISLNEVRVDKNTHIVIYQGGSYENELESLRKSVKELRDMVASLQGTMSKPSPFFGSHISPEPEGIEVRRDVDIKETFKTIITKLDSLPAPSPPPVTEEVEDAEDAEDAEEEDAEVEDAEDAEEEEEEEVALELEKFEYKGFTYYRDSSDQQVYQLDEDGDLDDTPIGVWNEEKKKVLKYAKA